MQSDSVFKRNIHLNLLFRITFLLILYTFLRFIFYFYNTSYFSDLSFYELLIIFFNGIRFDIVAVIILNIPFIVLFSVPFKFRYKSLYQKIGAFFYVIPNAIGFLGNCIDFEFFKFTARRMTSEIFNIIGIGDDFIVLLPQFLKDFWYILIIWIVFVLILILFYNKTKVVPETRKRDKNLKYYIIETLLFFIFIFIGVIGVRGGFQLKPISIINAGKFTNSKNIALVLNTPFSIIKTINKTELEDYKFYKTDKELEEIYSPIHIPKKNGNFNNMNVVIIILESFSKEYIGSENKNLEKGYKGYTPYLDSLINESLNFKNAFANGKRSIDAIPAVTSSIPGLMNNPYISSIYAGDNIYSIPKLLKEKGYQTFFFHGGTNGTMGFDSYAKMAGFDKYFGRSEYNNENDFDGKWGIYDEEFLQFSAKTLNKTAQPFFAEIFTLSSHHPYSVPEKYKNKFSEGTLPIHKSIEYADYALSQFFKTAQTMRWYNNTLFIITADHTSEASHPYYQNNLGIFSIPLLFYKPDSSLKKVSFSTTQQIDIMPSIMDFLNYDKPYIAFGNSVFDSTSEHFAINYINNTYQLIENGYAIQFDGKQIISLYNVTNDSLLNHNLINSDIVIANFLNKKIKAIIQSYNSRLIDNKMIIKNY
jgi:phosphoglycerol transferase MdoB-like AlkP superfamily enzyme